MIEPDPRFQRMADRHAEWERQRVAAEAERAHLLRNVVLSPAQPGESEPLSDDRVGAEHIGHRIHFCMGVSKCQCGAVVGVSAFALPSPGEVIPACEVCLFHGLPAEAWVGEDYDD